ncbi:MAG: OmpA family protein [Bacteroidia bacterium]|nr:OmpA family protein [Bacteroidia bacterium]
MKNVILFLMGTYALFAVTPGMASGKADLKKADQLFASCDYHKAIEYYKKAMPGIKRKSDKAALLYKTAECYRRINQPKQAEVYYRKCIAAGYADPEVWLFSGQCRMELGNYSGALDDFKKYKDFVPSDPRGELGIKSCELAVQWLSAPGPEKVENVQQINTAGWDYAPSYEGKKYNVLYFTSTRPGTRGERTDDGVGEGFADIFETRVDKNGKWSTPVPLPEQVNTEGNDGVGRMTRKGNAMYLTRCGYQRNKHLYCQILYSQKKGNTWTEPSVLPFHTDSFNYGHPAPDPQESFLVFASDKPGGYGGLDLWLTRFDKKANRWSDPENLGPGVNTPGDEVYPFLHDDGSLFFSSNGHPGMGGLDLFKASPSGSFRWANPENLKSPMNSPADDFGIIFEGKQYKGYLTSSRSGGKGGDDIYSFRSDPLIFELDGFVWDREFLAKGIKVPVKGALVRLLSSNGKISELRTNENGYFFFKELETGLHYVVQTRGEDRQWDGDKLRFFGKDQSKFSTAELEKSSRFHQELSLLREEEIMHLPQILYDVNEHSLNHPSNPRDSLEYLYKILMESPAIIIELASHTDYRNSHQQNDSLSYRRAREVVLYMISKGIPAGRMKAKGYGERKPLQLTEDLKLPGGKILPKGTVLTETLIRTYPAGSPDFELLNQMNRRTDFRIIGKNFEEKAGDMGTGDPFPEIELEKEEEEER